jgi:hypothetical protein
VASRTARIIGLVLLLRSLPTAGQAPAPATVKFCDIVSSPALYNQRQITTAATLSPGEHSLLLHSHECEPKAGFDVRVQTVLPMKPESLPHGQELKSILSHGRSAYVEIVGTFQATTGPYGPDGMPFRFAIMNLNSVVRAHREK